MAQTTQIQDVNCRDGNTNCGNITANYTNIYISDEDAQIMRWLSPLDPESRHQAVSTDRFVDAGEWLLETSEFRKWRGGEGGEDEAVLFCSGNPGVGKTYLSSLVIDRLRDQQNTVVVGLYCDYLFQQEQTVPNMIGAILKHLLGREDIPSHVRDAFHETKRKFGGSGPRLPELMRMLKITISSLPQVFICLDALDECLPKHLPQLLESLRDIVRECPRTRILFTGRPHVKEDIQRYFPSAGVIPISPNMDDIMDYLKIRLARDTEPEAMNEDLRADIIRTISEKISNIFLLVSLNMDAILGEITIRQRRKKVEEMAQGKGLSDAYTATLTRLKAQKRNKAELGLKLVMWVLYSKRPLGAEELHHALGVEPGSRDLDVDNIPALRTIVASSLGLVTVEKSSSTVRLVHFTLQEHLLSDSTLFPSPHSTIAEVCLTYLNFGSVHNLAPTLKSAPSTMPLLEYASCYWGKHARGVVTDNVKILALRLLDRFDQHISAQLLLLRSNQDRNYSPYFGGDGGPIGFTGLHGAAFLGIMDIITAVLEMKEWDVNAADGIGITALIWAARNGHEGVVTVLVQREGVNPDQAETRYGRTPLSWAAKNGHEGVVRILLQREGVNPDKADTKYGRTPLSLAAKNGREGVVKMLLQREGVNPDQADTEYGLTPLLWAARGGHEGIVKLLLQREGINPDRADTYGGTPLSWAAKNGHEGVVKLLLQREGVNINAIDPEYGSTPLSWAADYGNEAVVEILLQQEDIHPDQADAESGRTPLSWAAGNGHEGIAKLLLQRQEVNPNTADTEGQTPLSWAAKERHEGVVKMLLERKDVLTSIPDNKYRTPLSLACSKGHEEIVKMLQERDTINSDPPDPTGQTSLPLATERADECVAVKFQSPDINLADPHGRPTPVSAHPDELNAASGVNDTVSKSADSDPPSTQPYILPELPSTLPPQLSSSPITISSHPNSTRSIPSILFRHYFLVGFFISLLALFIYVLPSPLPAIFSFNK